MFGKRKDKFEKLIEFYKKTPSLVNLDVEDLKSLPEEVLESPLNNEYTYGYKDMRIMISAISNKLDEYCPLKADDIEYKGIFFAHQSNKAVDYDTMLGTFYFRVYFGNDTFYVYELDEFVRLINTRTFKVSEIIGISDTDRNLVLRYMQSGSKISETFLFVKKSEKDTELYTLLMKNYLSKDLLINKTTLENLLCKTGMIG